ncbi:MULTISPECIES: DUF5134 domain-containing protein [Streptomyces]|uniref:DUF5134 domain-containing protein n=1 Tax=Streptomyces edwardsiae TaxID=3075527 RepID=A0ABU2QAK8_9ACTN|nr:MULTISPECIES: DUF5134 domain-containing protein [unclassified Streptomyces]MDT0401454.1 DUF5134 domain-containing protein [Streptomyces sp. DSM 41635]
MRPADVLSGLLTALFAAAAVRGLWHGVLSPDRGGHDRVGHLLHTAMALAMAVMPWSPGAGVPGPPQAAFFAAAALWFPASALVRRHGRRPAAVLRSLPYAADMAAMALMAHRMTGHSHGAPPAAAAALAVCLLLCALRSLTRCMPSLRATAGRRTAGDPYTCFWDGSMALGTAVMLLMHP